MSDSVEEVYFYLLSWIDTIMNIGLVIGSIVLLSTSDLKISNKCNDDFYAFIIFITIVGCIDIISNSVLSFRLANSSRKSIQECLIGFKILMCIIYFASLIWSAVITSTPDYLRCMRETNSHAYKLSNAILAISCVRIIVIYIVLQLYCFLICCCSVTRTTIGSLFKV